MEARISPAGDLATTPLVSAAYTSLWTYIACPSGFWIPLNRATAGAQEPRSDRVILSSSAYAPSRAAAARMFASGWVRAASGVIFASAAPRSSRAPRSAMMPKARSCPGNSSSPRTIWKRVSAKPIALSSDAGTPNSSPARANRASSWAALTSGGAVAGAVGSSRHAASRVAAQSARVRERIRNMGTSLRGWTDVMSVAHFSIFRTMYQLDRPGARRSRCDNCLQREPRFRWR